VMEKASRANDESIQDFIDASKGVRSITTKIAKINEITISNTRSVGEIASAAEHLKQMTDELNTRLETIGT